MITGMNRSEKILTCLALLLLAASVYVHVVTGYVGDRNWLLVAAHMVLSGKRLYVDVFEPNPPLILWLYMIPVRIGALLHLPDYQMMVLAGLGMVALCIAVCLRIVSRQPAFAGNGKRQCQFALLLGLVFIAFTPSNYFFDREHILLVLSFPYVLRLMPSVARAPVSFRLRLLIGIMAGIGFCIKPHTVIVFTGLQVCCLLRERSARIVYATENLCIYMVAIGYLLAVQVYAPEYFQVVLPMALATYSGYSNGHVSIMYVLGAAFVFGVTFADFRLRYDSPYRKDILYLVAVSALWLCYAFANNGWGYTYNPLISTLLIVSGFVWWEHHYLKTAHDQQGLPSRSFLQGMRACMLLFMANAALTLYTFGVVFNTSCGDFRSCRSTEKLVDIIRYKHITSYGALTINYHLLPMLYREAGAELDTRFNALWMVPKFLKEDQAFTVHNRWILDYVAQALAQDLTRRQPQLVLVNTGINYKSVPTDLPEFFSAYPEFKNAWSHYRLSQGPDVPQADKDFPYQLYERIP